MENMYWDINKILPYQRKFNFINGERSLGKTYSLQKFLVNKFLQHNKQFIYIVRTADEKKHGMFKDAFSKVLKNEFPNHNFNFSNEEMKFLDCNNYDEEPIEVTCGYCLALSEAIKDKKRSFPDVYYIMFDEYMLSKDSLKRYVTGWNEPDLFLTTYHTVDREEDRVTCFLLGNTTSFFNPYHLHPSFNVKNINKGEMWKSKNVLFQWAESSQELLNKKNNNKFLEMIDNTTYGLYAKNGVYIDDTDDFIEKCPQNAKFNFTIIYNKIKYGIWSDRNSGSIYISKRHEPTSKLVFALTKEDFTENTLLTKTKSYTHLRWLARNFTLGNVKYESQEVKVKAEKAIYMLVK